MFGIGPMELVLIMVVALLVFGPKRVPELARTLGRGLAEFRRASNDLRQSLALDDLKRDLTQSQKIHRPGDRPAQAGDDVPTGHPGEAIGAPHPGELPLGNDHEHHDPEETGEQVSNAASGAPPATAPASPPTGPSASTRNSQQTATPADPGLGSVPVSELRSPDPKRG